MILKKNANVITNTTSDLSFLFQDVQGAVHVILTLIPNPALQRHVDIGQDPPQSELFGLNGLNAGFLPLKTWPFCGLNWSHFDTNMSFKLFFSFRGWPLRPPSILESDWMTAGCSQQTLEILKPELDWIRWNGTWNLLFFFPLERLHLSFMSHRTDPWDT